MPLFSGITQDHADALRAGASDAYGNTPDRQTSDGTAPCRCCLALIDEGRDMLVFAHRPFNAPQPYAETGPVFLCADHCDAVAASPDIPPVVVSPNYLLKGYSADERLVYGTGRVVPKDQIASYADTLLDRSDIAFVDLRSATNNCWQARMHKA